MNEQELYEHLLNVVKNNNIEKIKEVLEIVVDINARDKDDCTILHWTAALGRVEIIKELVGRGADIDAKDKDGWTPLHEAAYYGNSDIVKELLDAGADIEAKNIQGRTALHTATSYGRVFVIKELVGRGANLDLYTLAKYPKQVLEIKGTTNDVWYELLLIIAKEQQKYEKKVFKSFVLDFLNETQDEMPENIYIVLSIMIQ